MIYMVKSHRIDSKGNTSAANTSYFETEAEAIAFAAEDNRIETGDGFYRSEWDNNIYSVFDPDHGEMFRTEARITEIVSGNEHPSHDRPYITNTHGGPRPGAGRPSLDDDPANPTERHTVTLPADLWRRIEEAGDGNRSAGLRRLIHLLDTAKEL